MARVVLPGDFVTSSLVMPANGEERIIGAGLRKRADGVYATVAGVLYEKKNKIWVMSSCKRYTPQAGDCVLGVVSTRAGDYFRVDIGAADQALLNFVSFEGATKRNRPNLRVGDLLFAQVSLSSKHVEPELTCVDSEGRARGMGIITAPGVLFNVSLNYARRLISGDDTFLAQLGAKLKFENAIGMNGKIWISAENPNVTLAVQQAILEAETTFASNRKFKIDEAIYNATHGGKRPLDVKRECEAAEETMEGGRNNRLE